MRLYTEEQRDRAASVDLVPFLEARGERFKKSGSEYRWTTHDSVTVRKNVWYQHSNNGSGNAIDFLNTFYGMSLREAIKELLNGEEPAGDEGSVRSCHIPCRKEEKMMETGKNIEKVNEQDKMQEAKVLKLPEKNENNDIVREYLVKNRDECLMDGMDIGRMAKAEVLTLPSAEGETVSKDPQNMEKGPDKVAEKDLDKGSEGSTEPLVPVTKLSEIQETEVEWLWYPFIPLGKITLVQGNPGKGKTWLAMAICAYCTNRGELPNTVPIEPFNVIYQTAEDGLADTIKPRSLKCGADPERVIVINEDEKQLTMKDDRIEAAIRQNHARLLILDPLQAFIGADVDMNRANETRPIFQKLGQVAERTGCAIVLIGHLNKASGQKSDYRGLGSMDIAASVRSVIIVEKVEKETERDVRVVVQIKDSLAMKEDPVAFSLSEEGLTWIGTYKITADELLSGGKGVIKETKLDMAKRLIVEILSKYPRMALDDIYKKLKVHKISERTVRDAKSQLGDRLVEEYVQGHKVLSLKVDEEEKSVQEPENSDTEEAFQETA